MEIWEFRQKQALPYEAKIAHALNNELVNSWYTNGAVAQANKRDYILIELSKEYAEICCRLEE